MNARTLQFPKDLSEEVGRPRNRKNIPLEVRQAVFKRDGYCCHYCGSNARLSLDHKRTFKSGGDDTAANLVTACLTCNVRRNDKPYEAFRASVTFCEWPQRKEARMSLAQIRARADEITMDELREAVARIQLP